jgi:hypothetical protein
MKLLAGSMTEAESETIDVKRSEHDENSTRRRAKSKKTVSSASAKWRFAIGLDGRALG